MESEEIKNRALASILEKHTRPEVIGLAREQAVVLQEGQTLASVKGLLEEYREFPERIEGTSVHHTLASLIAHAKRWKRGTEGDDSAAFCSLTEGRPSITTIYDYHRDGEPAWRKHRATYAFPLSDAWKRWTSVHGKELKVSDFAQLLEDRLCDVAEPGAAPAGVVPPGLTLASPAALSGLAGGLQIRADVSVTEIRRRDNGTATLMFNEEHRGADDKPLALPNGFLLALPVFVGSAPFAVPARLRYRLQQGSVLWTVSLYQHEEALRRAVTESAEAFAKDAGVELFFGSPE